MPRPAWDAGMERGCPMTLVTTSDAMDDRTPVTRGGPGDGLVLRELLDHMAGGVAVFDQDFTLLSINRPGLEMDGRAEAEILGRSLWELWPGNRGTPIEAAYRRCMAERTPVDLEQRVGDAWLRIRVMPCGAGVAIHYEDVTSDKAAEEERARAAAALAESEARLRAVEAAAGIGVWEWTVGSETVYWSPGIRSLLGLPQGAQAT